MSSDADMKSKRIYKDEFHTITESDGELPFTVKRSIKAAMSDGTPYKNASLPRRVATLKDAVR